MATLPGLFVTDAQLPHITDHFASKDLSRTSTENYRRWLRKKIIEDIMQSQMRVIDEAYQVELAKINDRREAAVASVLAMLDDPADPYKPPLATTFPVSPQV